MAVLLLPLVGCQYTPCNCAAEDSGSTSARDGLTVMSFNIRNGKANDGENSWPNRRALVAGVIRDYDPDVLGVQEAFRFQLDHLAEDLPHYTEVGEGRGGSTNDEYSAILYRTDRFNLLDAGTFWLSDTPEKVSKTWGHYHYRICTWAHLKDRNTGQAFYIYNTHFDHKSQPARLNSAKLISLRIAERGTKDPVILTGDLNAAENNHAVQYLKGVPYEFPLNGPAFEDMPPIRLADTFRVQHPEAKYVGTGNGGYTGKRDGAKIDYILVGPGFETLSASIDQKPRKSRYPSDHYPVIAELEFTPPRPAITDEDLDHLEEQAD
jgi:endonuclease/exonuclease/phosphatase family metal-dependent hydrolase